MHERKALMASLADGYVALPGGFGTLDEWFEMLTWLQVGLHQKPIGLLDTDGFFAPLLKFVEHAAAEGFVSPALAHGFVAAREPQELFERLQTFEPPSSAIRWAP
jgi:uncharacterized protein (TIGR00730 family)